MRRQTTTKVFVVNQEGKVLILQSSEWEDRPDRSHMPDLPGGMVEATETPHEAVARETQEETGLRFSPDKFVELFSTKDVSKTFDSETIKYMFALRIKDEAITLSWEHEKYDWVTLKELETITWRRFYQTEISSVIESGMLERFGAC